MPRDPNTQRRRSVRLTGYDYRQPGAYFITLVTRHRECSLGDIRQGEMFDSPQGAVARACWQAIPDHFPGVELDAFVVMPNHLHGILCLRPDGTGNSRSRETNPYAVMSPRAGSLPVIIRTYKAAVTTQLRRDGYGDFAWQRSYHEHVIRHEDDLRRIREYIQHNPANWSQDQHNPKSRGCP